MRGFQHMFATAAVFGLLAGGAIAAPQAATDGKTPAQTTAAVGPLGVAAAPQRYSPIGGAFAPTLTSGAQGRGYFSGRNSTILGGWLGPAPMGGAFQAGTVGGTMNGQIPPGGRLTQVIIGGANPPGASPGGVLSGRPAGGQFGSNVLGGIHTPSNSFTAGPGGVIIGGAQTAGVSPGGVNMSGVSPGGVIVAGAPPNTNAPGGTLTNAPGGQLH